MCDEYTKPIETCRKLKTNKQKRNTFYLVLAPTNMGQWIEYVGEVGDLEWKKEYSKIEEVIRQNVAYIEYYSNYSPRLLY